MALPISSSRMAAGDVNGDGLNDLVVVGHDNRVLLLVLLQSATAHRSFLAPYVLN